MISRLFWIAAGAAAGIYVVRRVQRTAEALTPGSLASSFQLAALDLADAIREFAGEVREGMTERETELRRDLGLSEDGVREVS